MMIERRRHFGNIQPGTSNERIPVARADWTDMYPAERQLGDDPQENIGKVEAVTSPNVIRGNFRKSSG
jgi:hypothetical protein